VEDHHLYVAANRGPVHYRLKPEGPVPVPAAGGLVTALSGAARHLPMTWVATASGPGDRLVASQAPTMRAKPGLPRLRYVVPSEEALDWFYRHFSNPVLWFLQHGLWDELRRPNLTELVQKGWQLGYRPVNEAFAQAIAQEVCGAVRPVILTHDYHFYLLPALLRQHVPGALLQHFTHIPWPGPDSWEVLIPSVTRQICRGLLGADIVGFQTVESATNFLRCCERFVPGAQVSQQLATVGLADRSIKVKAYPISIDPVALRRVATSPEAAHHKARLLPLLGEQTIVRVDRLDPSKNIVRGFQAFGMLLERRPDLVGRVRFLAFLVPSRENIAEYRRHAQEVLREVETVNGRFGQDGWKPIELFHEDNRSQAIAGMALADVLLVNPVADGMNLVAKEGPIVSERSAVLVLSKECGAHHQLGSAALSIPPRDVAATTSALEQALAMPMDERNRRNRTLRGVIEAEDISWWMRTQLQDLFDS